MLSSSAKAFEGRRSEGGETAKGTGTPKCGIAKTAAELQNASHSLATGAARNQGVRRGTTYFSIVGREPAYCGSYQE